MLPYTAVDLITAMDREFAFEGELGATQTRGANVLRRSRRMLLTAAVTLITTTRR